MNKVTATRESSLPAGDPNDVLREFAANTAFRAAEWEELTTEDNPFRRPVRPDDLTWLDYSETDPGEAPLLSPRRRADST
jgi:hypothetical protein